MDAEERAEWTEDPDRLRALLAYHGVDPAAGVLAPGGLPHRPAASIHGAPLDVVAGGGARHRQRRHARRPDRGGQRHRLPDRRGAVRRRRRALTQSSPARRLASTASVRVVASSLRYSALRFDFTVFTDRNRRSPISA